MVNAVVDALRPYGVKDLPMPCTPERVWRAIHGDSADRDRTAGQGAAAQGGGQAPATSGGGQ